MYSKLEDSKNTVGHLVIRGILFTVLPRCITVNLACPSRGSDHGSFRLSASLR